MISVNRGEQGFTLVELLVAILLLVIGIMALVGVLESASRLSVVVERHTTMVHIAQRELERVEALPYAQAAMMTAPAHSAVTTDPNYYVADGPPATFQYDRSASPGAPEPIAVDATNGKVNPAPATWTDNAPSGTPRLSAKIYDYVTWATDPTCAGGAICPATQDYRRVTVEVTLVGAGAPFRPAIISSIIADPNATPNGAPVNSAQNPLKPPRTQCLNALSVLVPCTNGLGGGTPNKWFLCDTPAMTFSGNLFGSYTTGCPPPTGDHTNHDPIAPGNSSLCVPLALIYVGCQNPDKMGTSPPPQGPTTPVTPYCYATDIGCPVAVAPPPGGGPTVGGRPILRDSSSCTPANPWAQTDNRKGAFWTTDGLAADTTLTGDGGMTLYARTSSGVSAAVTICVGIYVMPASLLDLITVPPVQLGVLAYSATALAGVPTPFSFNFNFLGTGVTHVVVAGNRIGVRVWIPASSSTDVSLIYDHPNFASELQLNSQ